MSELTELTIAGRVAIPDDPDWDQARAAWNLAADQRPSAVAFVESAEDVAKTVRFASQHDLRVAGQGTGHGAVALGPLEETILVKTERMRGIEVDAGAQTARVEAGVLVLELSQAAQAHGLSSMPDSSPAAATTRSLGEAIESHLDRLREATRPWAADGGYFNFAERPCDADAILPAETCARLAEVKRKWGSRRHHRRQPHRLARRRELKAPSQAGLASRIEASRL